jgi:dolichol kinase
MDALPELLGRDAGAMVFGVGGALALTSCFELLASRGLLQRVLSRKLVHVLSGPLFACSWSLYSPSPFAPLLASAVPALQMLRLLAVGTGVLTDERSVRSISRSGARSELLRGPLFYSGVITIVTASCWRTDASGVLVISLLCGGDGLADIAGRALGGPKLLWNKSKSLAGSASMAMAGFALGTSFIAFFHSQGYMHLQLSTCVQGVLLVSIGATLVESLPINQYVDDNISVPVTTYLLAELLDLS